MLKQYANALHKLLFTGHTRVDDPLMKMRLLAFNGTVVAVVLICSFVLCVYLAFGYFERIPSLLPWMTLFPVLLYLCHRGHFLAARVVFMLVAWCGISFGVYLFGREGMVGLYCLPATFFPFVLFTGREWRWLVFFTIGSLSLFALIQWVFPFQAAYPLPPGLAEFSALIHTLASFLTAVLPFILLFFQAEIFYREVLRKTEERVHAERIADLGRIAAGTAHEVNNPLTIVHFVLQLMENDSMVAARPELQDRIRKGFDAIDRIRIIVQRLLSLTQSPMDAYESISLLELTEIIDHLYAEQMRDSGVRFTLDAALNPEDKLYGQKGRVLEILFNLISNALEAVQGVHDATISIDFRLEGESLSVLVRDNGPGVAPERVDRIFAPFFTTKEYGKGTGLGLSSSRSIARHHGGDLLCYPGPGGQFLLRLPLAYRPESSLTRVS